MRIIKYLSFALLAVFATCDLALAADVHTAQEARASKLLNSAVAYYRTQGDAAFAAFSRQGEFIDGEHYVFVVDSKGTMLASGGSSAVLIGRDVSKAIEPELNKAFQAALLSDEDGQVRSAEYRWLNVRDGRVERKKVFYQRVGDRILAVGLYLPRATPAQAETFLDRVAQELGKNADGTLEAINNLSADYHEDDLYAFVIDLRTKRYVAHGYNRRLVGVDFSSIVDPEGRPVGKPMLALIEKAERAGYDYRWKNPVTSKVEDKHALMRKIGGYMIAVGYYRK
ncbi:cache domain-containing protein [Pseudomonas sp. NPDC078700]|uniref:cache domain-containing protein n=1 Tax=Pseudomonas sp. NPDC078700 TaxID=3364424 RepID=UPI0037CB9929